MANKNWTKTTIKLSESYSASERREIAQDFVDYIEKRTKKGKGEDNKRWEGSEANKYTDAYKKSEAFKSKKDKSRVNLSLFEKMLPDIGLIKNSPGEIAIGIKKNSNQYGKAEGNARGTYGNKKANPAKARPFMGLSDDEIEKILRPYEKIRIKRKEDDELMEFADTFTLSN